MSDSKVTPKPNQKDKSVFQLKHLCTTIAVLPAHFRELETAILILLPHGNACNKGGLL